MLAACVADGLVFVAGLDACDGEGLAASARVQPTAPYFHDPARAQMRVILDKAGTILKAAGSDLEHVVRVIQFHSELAAAYGSFTEWFNPGVRQGMATTAIKGKGFVGANEPIVVSDLWSAINVSKSI
jgi:enamine deaminase RidA (YjgF/YER057c/UK114 family)